MDNNTNKQTKSTTATTTSSSNRHKNDTVEQKKSPTTLDSHGRGWTCHVGIRVRHGTIIRIGSCYPRPNPAIFPQEHPSHNVGV